MRPHLACRGYRTGQARLGIVCPRPSAALRAVDWRAHKIPTALATDGPGSNNSQDMLEALKFTACLQKADRLDATVLLPEDVLEMAYRGGARAMRLGDQIGRLTPGAFADMVIVSLHRAHIAPVYSPHSALVYNANGNDVDTVIVAGKPYFAMDVW